MDPTVTAAIVMGVCAVAAAVPGAIAARRVNKVHDEVRTNHGLRQGDYVELTAMVVGELKTAFTEHVEVDKASFDALTAGQAEIRAEQARVAGALAKVTGETS